jgi:hypothetical protein
VTARVSENNRVKVNLPIISNQSLHIGMMLGAFICVALLDFPIISIGNVGKDDFLLGRLKVLASMGVRNAREKNNIREASRAPSVRVQWGMGIPGWGSIAG